MAPSFYRIPESGPPHRESPPHPGRGVLVLQDEHRALSPLTTFSYLLNYTVFGNGPHPAGYHWVNFALHAVNIALVYLLGLLLFQESKLKERVAFALAAVWSLHPVLTESVTNIVGRADLLAGFGVLAGLLCHIHGGAASGWRKSLGSPDWRWPPLSGCSRKRAPWWCWPPC